MVDPTRTNRDFKQDRSISKIVQRFKDQGYASEFSVVGPERMRCNECREELDASTVTMKDLARVDVTTDPGDQSVVTALECPKCGAKGTRVFSYGPMASMEDKSSFGVLRNERVAASGR